ncbi:hypothetical protein Micbo1qcDRAFT_163593, partial [Microdochium bolleyi]
MRPTGAITISDDEGAIPAKIVRGAPSTKRKRYSEPVFKVEWSDESEGGWETFKKRKKGKASRRVPAGAKDKGKAVARSASVRGPRKTRKDKDGRAANDDSLSEDDILEQALPDYLRIRRRDFDQSYRAHRTAGLRLPPSYDDIYFSDDEQPAKLEVKPRFDKRSGIKPSHEYKDIVLEHSAGVIPAPIAQYLRDYQVEGVRFLHHLFVYQRGGILG